METFKIKKINGKTVELTDDCAASEVPLTFIIGDKEIATLLCTPEDIEDLSRGFLFTSGLIKNNNDIKKIVVNYQQWTVYIDLADTSHLEELLFKRIYTSGCGRGVLFYNASDIMYKRPIKSNFSITNTFSSHQNFL